MANGPATGEKPGGIGFVRFLVTCPGPAEPILLRAKSLLSDVDNAALAGWPVKQGSEPHLPDWFTMVCAPPMSRDEAEQWLAYWKRLQPDEQAKAESEEAWAVDDWLYWLEPRNRQWFWWDAKVEGNDAALAIEVEAWPFPWGSLRWLLRAAGASDVQPEE